jgi:hypothetical protein
VAVAIAWALLGTAFAWSLGPNIVVAEEESPNGRYAVVVEEQDGPLETYWHVSIRQTSGVLAREWNLGCLDGDNPAVSFRRAKWASSGRLRLKLLEHEVEVPVETNTGEPRVAAKASVWGC